MTWAGGPWPSAAKSSLISIYNVTPLIVFCHSRFLNISFVVNYYDLPSSRMTKVLRSLSSCFYNTIPSSVLQSKWQTSDSFISEKSPYRSIGSTRSHWRYQHTARARNPLCARSASRARYGVSEGSEAEFCRVRGGSVVEISFACLSCSHYFTLWPGNVIALLLYLQKVWFSQVHNQP